MGRTGRLVLEIPKVYQIKGDDHAIKATLTEGSSTKVVDIEKNLWNPVGEGGSGDETTLLELNATGDGPMPVGSPGSAYPAVTAITIGQPGRPDSRVCTGTVVDPLWVLSAKSCFADAPGTSIDVAAGAPKVKTTVSIDRTDIASPMSQIIEVAELMPREDRDLVLLKLAKPATDVMPITVSATAPAVGEVLKTAGFGRTKDRWLSAGLHTGQFTVNSTTATTVAVGRSDADSTICKGDAGGPALRESGGTVQLVAIHSRSWQGGCLGVTETRTDATETRLDDLLPWLQQLGVQYASSGYTTVPTTRVLDTRVTGGRTWDANLDGGVKELNLGPAGTSPVKLPAGATAVVLNVTVINPARAGFLAVEPTKTSRPTSSAINYAAGQIIPNLITAPVNADGTVYLWSNNRELDVVVDVQGYYSPQSANRFTARTPVRLLDTRSPVKTLAPYSSIDVQVAGQNGVPANATAAVLNLTVTGPAMAGNLIAYPAGTTRPSTSNVNFTAGQTISNQAIVPIGADGKVTVYNHNGGKADVIVDFFGDYSPTGASLFRPVTPHRVLDTRLNGGAPLSWGQVKSIDGTPPGATATVLNLTAVQPESAGFFTLYPRSETRPVTSNINFAPGDVLSAHATVSVGNNYPISQNSVHLYSGSGNVHAIADLYGYFTTKK
ncbi:S1 family peptidase [Streptomyces sp. SBC-4]|nr:S1 family peptidase [Streptomyces sp. SBC-4]MDV5145393.1 S1 family peptidase [Streptomyces sp. SBC-4]